MAAPPHSGENDTEPAMAAYERGTAPEPIPALGRSSVFTPLNVSVGAVSLAAGILLMVALQQLRAGLPAVPPSPAGPGGAVHAGSSAPSGPQVDPAVVREYEQLRDKVRTLIRQAEEIDQDLFRLGGYGYDRRPTPAWRLDRSIAAVLRPRSGLPSALLAPFATALFGPVDSGVSSPGHAATPIDYAAQNEALRDTISELESAVEKLRERRDRLRGFDDCDLILTERDQSAVAIRMDDGRCVVAATARRGEIGFVQSLLAHSGRARLTDSGELVRLLKRMEPGSDITDRAALEKIAKLFKPRLYVPAEADPEEMVAFQSIRGRGRGDSRYEIGYLMGVSDQPRGILAATIDYPEGKEVKAADLLGSPARGRGDDLLAGEPRVNFLDYALLEIARTLHTGERAAYQRVAITADVELNEAYYRQLSDYSANKNIAWLAVAKQDEVRALRGVSDGLFDQQRAMTAVKDAAARFLKRRSSDLGLPIVERDERALRELLREQVIAGDAQPSNSFEKELRAMREAAARGNLIYAGLSHEEADRKLKDRLDASQDYREQEFRAGGTASRFSRRDALAGFGANAYGYGYGYGGGYGERGRVRYGRRGARYGRAGGYGGGGGGGGGSVDTHIASSGTEIGEQTAYRDSRRFASEANQAAERNLSDNTTRDNYGNINSAEQVAKRDAALDIEDYGRLAAASHVIRLVIGVGSGSDLLSYQVSLRRTHDGATLWQDYQERPIYSRPLAETSYLASGQLWVINPLEPQRRGEQAPLDDVPQVNRNGKLPPLVIDASRRSDGKLDTFRTLLTTEPVEIPRQALVGSEGGDGRSQPIRIDDKSDLEHLPYNQKLRCSVLKLVEAVAPKAGEVVEVEPASRQAKVRLVNADRTWRVDESLRASRFEDDSHSLDEGSVGAPLPLDVFVQKRGKTYADVVYRSAFWEDGEDLVVGDRLVARDAVQPLVAIAPPEFWYAKTEFKKYIEYQRADPSEKDPPELNIDRIAKPDAEAIKRVFKNPGWTRMRGKLSDASEAFATDIYDSLRKMRVEAAYLDGADDALPVATTHVVRCYLRPVSPRNVRVGIRVVDARTGREVLHIKPVVALDEVIAWNP